MVPMSRAANGRRTRAISTRPGAGVFANSHASVVVPLADCASDSTGAVGMTRRGTATNSHGVDSGEASCSRVTDFTANATSPSSGPGSSASNSTCAPAGGCGTSLALRRVNASTVLAHRHRDVAQFGRAGDEIHAVDRRQAGELAQLRFVRLVDGVSACGGGHAIEGRSGSARLPARRAAVAQSTVAGTNTGGGGGIGFGT